MDNSQNTSNYNIDENAIIDYINTYKIAKNSPIRVGFYSAGGATGTYNIRGMQIAAMRNNWGILKNLQQDELAKYDVICCVKKPFQLRVNSQDMLDIHYLKAMGKKVIVDVVDCWSSRRYIAIENYATIQDYFADYFRIFGADGYIFTNKKMYQDLSHFTKNGTYIYHHYRPNITRLPVRKKISTICYSGLTDFVEQYLDELREICRQKNMQLLINPPDFNNADALINIRKSNNHPLYQYCDFNYKPNTKIAIAYGLGIPFITDIRDQASIETDCGEIFYYQNIDDISLYLDQLNEHYSLRAAVNKKFISESEKYTIDNIVNQYEQYFMNLL